MASANQVKVERREDGSLYVAKETWSDIIPADMIDHWIDWYAQMHKQHGYDGYREMSEALRAAKAS